LKKREENKNRKEGEKVEGRSLRSSTGVANKAVKPKPTAMSPSSCGSTIFGDIAPNFSSYVPNLVVAI
jgi:hypothetical protein